MSNILLKDEFNFSKDSILTQPEHQQTLWRKTRILGGYDKYVDKYGISRLGEVVFDDENIVPIGGVQYAMEKIFNVAGPSDISNVIGFLNDKGIGSQSYSTNDSPYPAGHCVCLWGLGLGGAAENGYTVLDLQYRDTEIPEMIPFRYTNETLEEEEENQYFGKKMVNNNGEDRKAYFLKTFEGQPVIRHQWKSGELDVDGPELTGETFVTDSTNEIESYTEIELKIKPTELKEWFDLKYKIEEVRFNTLALYTGVYDPNENDYAMIKMFSRLNIPTEHLALLKDLTILYRVYGA